MASSKESAAAVSGNAQLTLADISDQHSYIESPHCHLLPTNNDSAEFINTLQAHNEKAGDEKAEGSDATAPDPAEFPDGGIHAWSVVFGGWCCLFVSQGWNNCIGVFQDYYQGNQLSYYPPSIVAWISSTETFMIFAGAPLFGKIYDNYGARPLLLLGLVFHVLGLMMISFGTQYYQIFLAQAVCSAIGASAIFYAGINPIGSWFWKNRAFAFGVVSSGSSIGAVIIPIMFAQIVPRIGFPWTMRAIGFMYLGLIIIANFTVKSRLKPHRSPFVFQEFITPLREPAFLFTAMATYFFFWGVFVPFNFIILEAQHFGMSANLAGYLLAILNATSVFGRIVPGWLGDRVGRFNVMILTTLASAILVLALWIPAKSNAPIIVFAALFGFTSGCYVSMVPALVAQISDIREIGLRSGTTFFIVSIATLTGQPIAGALVTKNDGGYLYLQIFCGIVMVIGSSLFFAARTAQSGISWAKL